MFASRTHHVVLAVRIRALRGAIENHVIHDGARLARDPLVRERALDAEAHGAQALHAAGLDGLAGQRGQEEPVAAVRHVPHDPSEARDFD